MLLAAALTLLEVVTLQGPLHHVQGIDVEGDIVWVSSVDRQSKKGFLARYDRHTGRRLLSVEVQDGERYHPGGIALDGGSLWVPVAEYRRESSAWIERRDKTTLRLIDRFAVDDHVGCLAAGGGRVFGGNWDSRQIYEWDVKGRQISRRDSPTGTGYQDLKLSGGDLIGGGLRGREAGAVDWLDPQTLSLRRRLEVGKSDRGVVYTHEGMAIGAGYLYVLPEDDPSRLFVFRLP